MPNMPEPPDWTAGLKIETTVELDAAEGLGICISELDSKQQADFLVGLADGFASFPEANSRDLQCAFIADHFKDSPGVARGVCELLTSLAEFIDEAVSS